MRSLLEAGTTLKAHQIICDELSDDKVSWLFHVKGVAIMVLLCGIFDLIIRGIFTKVNIKSRWFALHSFVNILVACTAAPDVVRVLSKPLCSMVLPMEHWAPSHLSFGLHLYHFAGYDDLRAEDIWHHVVFVGSFGVVNFGMSWGPVVNLLLFFMTGLPGALDYALLSLVKANRFDRLKEKRLNAHINIWLRMPGLVVVATIMFACAAHGMTTVHWGASALCVVLAFGNGVYYMQQVVRNYESEKAKAGQLEKSKQTGKAEKAKGDEAKKDE